MLRNVLSLWRSCSSWSTSQPAKGREYLTELALRERTVLEIGPFCNPVLRGANVSYADVLDRDGLVDRATAIGYPAVFAPDIDFVAPNGDLSAIDRTFSAALSCHCIEHQPDLIGHLRQVSRLLAVGGTYYVIIPDKRFCFDATLDTSTAAEVIAAHLEKRTVHTLQSVMEHRALTTHNDPARHWRGDNKDANYDDEVIRRIPLSIAEHKGANGSYVDVHAWQFTPDSFASVFGVLRRLKYIDFDISDLFQPVPQRNEFAVILRRV